MKTFTQFCKEKKFEMEGGFIQIHIQVFTIWKLYLRELAWRFYLKGY